MQVKAESDLESVRYSRVTDDLLRVGTHDSRRVKTCHVLSRDGNRRPRRRVNCCQVGSVIRRFDRRNRGRIASYKAVAGGIGGNERAEVSKPCVEVPVAGRNV